MNFEVEERVDRLETLLAQFIVQTNTALTRFERGLESFKDEMRDFKDEMQKSRKSQDEQIHKMNKQWGDLANKLGTLVEDLVIPGLPHIVSQKFNVKIERAMPRLKQRLNNGGMKEFDLIALSREYVFLNSTKSTLKSENVVEFIDEINLFWELFPEHRNKKLIGILASLYIDESVVTYAERKGFLVLGIGMEVMEIKNRPEFQPKTWIYGGS